MKNSSNTLRVVAIFLALSLALSFSPLPRAAAACLGWTLVAKEDLIDLSPDSEGSVAVLAGSAVPTALVTPAQNQASGETAPALPALRSDIGGSIEWQCTSQAGGPPSTAEEQGQPQGTEACQKAARLAAKYAGFTALNLDFKGKLKDSVVQNVTNFLKGKLQEDFNITLELDYNKVAQAILGAATTEKISNAIKGSLGNLGGEFKKGVADKAQQIIDGATDELKKYVKDAAKSVVGDVAGGLISTKVPVEDVGTQKKLEEVKAATEKVIAEQKRAQVIQDTRDKCNELLKTTQETIKRALLYQLSTQIVDWIQGGFKDKPQFIKQPGKFLEATGRLALDRFISRVAPRLCQPFRLNVQILIPTTQREANPFYEQITCSLDRVVENVQGFYNDFRQGGWIAYQEVWKPQNNYYGALLMTMDEALREEARAKEDAERDLAQGRGFQSERECVKWVRYESIGGEPRGLQARDPNRYRTDVKTDKWYEVVDTQGPTADGGPPETDLVSESGLPPQKDARFWPRNSAAYFWECEDDRITRPATLTAGVSEKAMQADLDYLAGTADIENFLQTIEDAIVNKLVKSGVKWLQEFLPRNLPAIRP